MSYSALRYLVTLGLTILLAPLASGFREQRNRKPG
jgi:hypothetical protein